MCDSSSGVATCVDAQLADSTPCNDNDATTGGDVCSAGTCAGVDRCATVDCTQACSVGTCSSLTGACSFVLDADGASCDDSDSATVNDQCVAGTCQGQDPCAAATCPVAANSAESQCQDPVCTATTLGAANCGFANKADNTLCADADASTEDLCQAGTCVSTPIQPSITQGLADSTLGWGTDTTFFVAVDAGFQDSFSNDPLVHEWKVNDVVVPSAAGSLQLPFTFLQQSFHIRYTASRPGGSISATSAADVTVDAPAIGDNPTASKTFLLTDLEISGLANEATYNTEFFRGCVEEVVAADASLPSTVEFVTALLLEPRTPDVIKLQVRGLVDAADPPAEQADFTAVTSESDGNVLASFLTEVDACVANNNLGRRRRMTLGGGSTTIAQQKTSPCDTVTCSASASSVCYLPPACLESYVGLDGVALSSPIGV